MVIRDLLSSEELKLDHALKRIKNMTRSMIYDAISSIKTILLSHYTTSHNVYYVKLHYVALQLPKLCPLLQLI